MDAPLATIGTIGLLEAALYVLVARLVRRRATSRDARLANDLFAWWWASLALLTAASALYALAATLAAPSLLVTTVLLHAIQLAPLPAAWSLLSYLLYLRTGRYDAMRPLAIAYAGLAGIVVALLAWMRPLGVTAHATGVEIHYAHEPAPIVAFTLALLVTLPLLLGVLAYATLWLRTPDPHARYRIATVTSGLAFGLLWDLLATPALGASTTGRILAASIGAIAPLLVLLAFRPPAWVRRRIEARAVGA